MDMIALPEWSSDYVAEPTPWSGRGAETFQEFSALFCAAIDLRSRPSRSDQKVRTTGRNDSHMIRFYFAYLTAPFMLTVGTLAAK